MGLVERWNKLAKKNLYVNKTWEIPMGRVMYMCILNGFLSLGMLLSGGNLVGVVWLWGDMVASFRSKGKENGD